MCSLFPNNHIELDEHEDIYHCDTYVKMSFGNYLWCYNDTSPTGHGFTLSNYQKPYHNLKYDNSNTHMMLLKLLPNKKLLRDCDFYDIYTNTGFLLGYNVSEFRFSLEIFKQINPELINTELKIVFSRKKQLTKEEQEIVFKRMIRTPREEIYTINLKIPEITQFGDKTNCNICLDIVDKQNNKYISSCGHLFHLNCIFEYLEKNNLLYSVHPRCKNCCNSRKIKPFECIVCKTLITK